MITRAAPLLLLAACATVSLAACGGSSEKKPATQLAAKINQDEISVHQVNAQLARMGSVPEAQRPLAAKTVLEGLIDQQLFIQQAIEKKLDRDPEVLAALEGTRRQILAQAYVQKTLGAQARPTEEEVKKYYADNPPLFAQRKVYRLREITAKVPADRVAELNALAGKVKSLAEIAPWLRDNKFEFAVNEAVRTAEQIPLDSLKRLSEMKDGEIGVFANDKDGVAVLQIAASQSAPVSEKDATPVIEQYFANLKRDQLARGELKRLRETAKIEYVGDYAKLAQSAPPAVAAPAVAKPADPAPPADAAKPAADALDKGVAGLR